METINEVLNRTVDLQTDPTREQFQSTLDSVNRLIDELELPKNRELLRFLVAWRGLEENLARIEAKLLERLAQEPINKVNKFLKKLTKKN